MIPLVDLAAQYRAIRGEVQEAIDRVLSSSQFILGPEAEAFEAEFASYCGVPHAVGVNSGTSALHLALLADGIGPGDEVITTPFTFVATVAMICQVGAKPVLVDVELDTLNIDPELVARAITPRTKAIMPVHIFGQVAEMDPMLTLAERHGLTVIEDAAQAHGATYRGRSAGSMGSSACFSFYPGKNLGAYGEAGMVVTADAQKAAKIRMLRHHGQSAQYEHQMMGFNYRIEAIQAAILRVKLRHLERWTELRREHARRYDALFAGTAVRQPTERAGNRHVFHLYVARVPERDRVRRALTEAGIQSGVHYPKPVHMQPGFRGLGYAQGDFPVAEAASTEVISLPLYPELTPSIQQRVAEVTLRALEGSHEPVLARSAR